MKRGPSTARRLRPKRWEIYFSQGQFERSLRIFEKLVEKRPSNELARKVNACRVKLSMGKESILRNRKIEVLREVLKRAQHDLVRVPKTTNPASSWRWSMSAFWSFSNSRAVVSFGISSRSGLPR